MTSPIRPLLHRNTHAISHITMLLVHISSDCDRRDRRNMPHSGGMGRCRCLLIGLPALH